MADATGQEGSPGAKQAPGGPATESAGAPTPWTPPPRPPRPGPAPGVEYAGFWIRTGAYLIDAVPFLVIGFIAMLQFTGAMFEVMRDIPLPPPGASPYSPEYRAWELAVMPRLKEALGAFYPFVGFFQLASVVYFVGFWTWRGQTPGMMLLGLRVARETDGANPGLARSILRYVGYVVSWIALFIGFIWVAFDGRKQGWHDKIAGTVVVRRAG